MEIGFLGALFITGLLFISLFLLAKWGELKTLQRAISIANKASGFIGELDGRDTGYKTIEMREVVNTLDMASRCGREHLEKKGSSEL